jgi:hypothetical protein
MNKILCLHGYTQNAEALIAKTGALRKHLKARAELVYVSAPHQLEGVDGAVSGQHTWWFSEKGGTTYNKSGESLQYLSDVLHTQGPFDGVFGFSQGDWVSTL